MALSKKQRHQLSLASKRRARRPQPTLEFTRPMTVGNRERNRATQTNAPMMLRLETVLVEAAERNDKIDDGALATALRCVVQRKDSPSEIVTSVMEAIEGWRYLEENDEQTDVVMRVIYNSIKTHSECEPGDYHYLVYASAFVKHATKTRF